MQRKQRNVIIMVAVVALLGLGVLAEQVRHSRFGPRTFLSAPRNLQQIERSCGGCASLTLLKRQGRWEIVRPYVAPASADNVERLIGIASAPVRHRYAAAELDETGLGFQPPFAKLVLGDRTIEFGAATPGKDRYARSDGEVALVQDRFAALLTAPPEEFVDRRLLRGERAVSIVAMGTVLPPERVEAYNRVQADRVVPLPATTRAHYIEVRYESGRSDRFTFEHAGDEITMIRRGDKFAYVLGLETQRLLGMD